MTADDAVAPGGRAQILGSTASRAPLRPAIHVSAPTGWLNDPNGLCFVRGTWHAFYQHDPDVDDHVAMHWGHATSPDLLHWRDQPIALSPDPLGTIYSGSIVVDDSDTAGFGAGAMVAAFTHSSTRCEQQSLAYSLDHGMTWHKYAHNPVLESDERDFRDPKVIRYGRNGPERWVMALAVGTRIEFYASSNLRDWQLTGSFTTTLETTTAWECPDLVAFDRPDRTTTWMLIFSVADFGPYGHGGTLAVLGDFDGETFLSDAGPMRLDHGPDFYAAQTFSGLPPETSIAMGWMSSWRYARTHPSTGRRGTLSFPRRLTLDDAGAAVRMTPAVDLTSSTTPAPGHSWSSRTGRALHIRGFGDTVINVDGEHGTAAQVTVADGSVSLWRHDELRPGHDETHRAHIENDGSYQVIVDHGTLEVFITGGPTLSALTFPGEQWTVDVEGNGELATISPPQ